MALITRNEYGSIAVNNRVLSKMIAQELLTMSNSLIPCNKKGKIIKNKPTPFIDPDVYDSIEIIDDKHGTEINVYIIMKFGLSISVTSNAIMDYVEKCYSLLQVDKPKSITVMIKGIKAKQLVKRDIHLSRYND